MGTSVWVACLSDTVAASHRPRDGAVVFPGQYLSALPGGWSVEIGKSPVATRLRPLCHPTPPHCVYSRFLGSAASSPPSGGKLSRPHYRAPVTHIAAMPPGPSFEMVRPPGPAWVSSGYSPHPAGALR